MSAIRLLALLLVCLAMVNAVVHKIQTQHHALSGKHSKHLFGRASLRQQQLYRRKVGMQASVGKLPLQHLNYLTIGTITVGTPPQTFNVEVDAFYENELMVIDVNANLSSVSKTVPEKSTYNAEKSSTYVAVNGNASAWGMKAHKAQDVLNIDSVSGTVKSFLVADKVPYFINYYPVDGLLGLSPSKKSYFNVSIVSDDLVTLGAEDSDNCQSTWSYVPSLKYYASSPFTVHASSAEVTIGGQLTTVNLDANVTFMSWPALDVSYAAKDLFVNGTGAIYNESVGYYTIDCDTTKAPLITLNLGGVGNSTDSTSQKLVLSGADYIRSWKSMGVCYLGVNFYRGNGMWYLGSQVLNNHCISFNYKERTVGFADSKTPKTDVTAY
ncbi:eukaryotic aspartyl protease domain-containing protein [Ditylenchus destructor]|uniref:Eukaryotic aspartyl protease domain-containing protein n=1 Tax=Ditylenchus destructor TaxID=166010 RepID=A0AAD4MYS7_9BILA|nr:eukaryotic aspartyl protease domain-containing protein [Ditylenchus destructor]